MGTENMTQYMGGGWILVADEKEADFYVAKGDYIKKGILDPTTGTTTWYVKKKKSTPQPTKPPQPTTQPQPTQTTPTSTNNISTDPPYTIFLKQAQDLERDGQVVDCDDTFPLFHKKGIKRCKSTKIGNINKCLLGGNELNNVFTDYTADVLIDQFNILDLESKGLSEKQYNDIISLCGLKESEYIRKIIKENTIKILSEYLNK